MKKKSILLIVAILFIAVSCDKDQRAVRKLDGKWNATKFVEIDNGQSFDWIAFGLIYTMEFSNCKLKDNEWCSLETTTTFSSDSNIDNVSYKVSNDGRTLTMVNSPQDTEFPTVFDVIDLKSKTVNLELKSNGEVVGIIELEKM